MNGTALMATVTFHAGLLGLLNSLPQRTVSPQKITRPISLLYHKSPPIVIAPMPPVKAPAPKPKKIVHRHTAEKPKPPPEKKVIPPAPPPVPLKTTDSPIPADSAGAASVVTIPARALPKLSEEALPEGYVEEKDFTYAPLYRVTEPPRMVSKLKLEYPERAREFQKEGIVILEVDIDILGHVLAVRVVEEPGWGFGPAALKAVQKAEFAPAKIGGDAVPVRYRIPIRFEMDFS